MYIKKIHFPMQVKLSKFIFYFLYLALFFMRPLFSQTPVTAFFNEKLEYEVQWKGFTVGYINMVSQKESDTLIAVNAAIDSFSKLKYFFYIGGTIGAHWNYKSRSSYTAFEDVYQGYTYQKRNYTYDAKKVHVKKIEKVFTEASYPHKSMLQKYVEKEEDLPFPEYQDLLGVFYALRSGPMPKVGDIIKLKALPAGVRKVIIIEVLGKKEVFSAGLNKTLQVYHVKSALGDFRSERKESGGDVFFATQSPIEMYIADDGSGIPVKMWTIIPYLGRLDIVLKSYTQGK